MQAGYSTLSIPKECLPRGISAATRLELDRQRQCEGVELRLAGCQTTSINKQEAIVRVQG